MIYNDANSRMLLNLAVTRSVSYRDILAKVRMTFRQKFHYLVMPKCNDLPSRCLAKLEITTSAGVHLGYLTILFSSTIGTTVKSHITVDCERIKLILFNIRASKKMC